MATLAYTAAIQTRIYSRLGYTLSTADGETKTLIDGTWTSSTPGGCALDALTEIQQIGQYFWLGTPATVPSEWESWLVARTVLKAGQVLQPDRVPAYEEENARAEMAALDAYNRNAITYDPTSTPEAATLTVQNLRYYVVSSVIRRPGRWETVEGRRQQRPRQWPDFVQVDASINAVAVDLWNRSDWPFKRRSTTLVITPYAVSDGTFAHAGKTITKVAGFATTIPAGALAIVTAGTGATLGEYVAASSTADVLTLTSSIGSAADAQTDIDVTVIAVTHGGLVSETFHAVYSRDFRYADADGQASRLKWVDGTDMAAHRARRASDTTTGRPEFFRFDNKGGVRTWQFDRIPDQAYTLTGEVSVVGPSLSSLSDTTTALARFPAEFQPVIRDRVLAKVLRLMGDPLGKELWEETGSQIDNLLPRYIDVGRQDDDQCVRDVYHDLSDFTTYDGIMGGGL